MSDAKEQTIWGVPVRIDPNLPAHTAILGPLRRSLVVALPDGRKVLVEEPIGEWLAKCTVVRNLGGTTKEASE